MKAKRKQDIISFKVDESLARAMEAVPNRSEFIRSAILAALDSTCPLCQGTGLLTPEQKRHWDALAQTHAIEKCKTCHAVHLTCAEPSNHATRAHK